MNPVFQFVLLLLLFAGSVIAPWRIWSVGQHEFSAKQMEFRRGAAELDEQAATNRRLSNLAAPGANNVLSIEQFRELMRLRGEIGTLRRAAADAEKLRVRNEKLRARLSEAPALPDQSKVQFHWPKSQLAPAGFADPVSGVQTTLWAACHNDPLALAGAATPESISRFGLKTTPPDEKTRRTTQNFYDSLSPATSFSVVGQEFPAADEADVKVYFEGEGGTHKFIMQKVSGEWKFDSIGGIWP